MIALNVISEKLLELALPPLATAIAGLLVAFLTRKMQSIGITISEQQQAQLKAVAREAVLAMEEKARRTPMPGAAKDAAAIGLVKDKLPDADIADIRTALDATLPEVRQAGLKPSTPGTFGKDYGKGTL